MLKVLLLEDSPRDVEIIRELLIDAGFDLDMDCAELEKEFVSLLRSRSYDIILADFKLPGFDGFVALHWSVEICPQTPFICVSGSIGEEIAVELLKQGAVDYVLKERLTKLPLAINRALGEVEEKEARRKAEATLRESEEKFRSLFESSQDAIMIMEPPYWRFTAGNPAAVKMFGAKNEEEFVSRTPGELSPDRQPDGRASVEKSREMIETALRKGFHIFEWTHRRIGGENFSADVLLTRMKQNGKRILQATVRNIADRKWAEEKLRREQIMLARTENIARIGSWEWDMATDAVTWSDELFRIFQRDPSEGAPSFADQQAFYHPDDMAQLLKAVEAAVADGTPYELELRAVRKDGETRVCVARGVAEMAPGGRPVGLFGSLQDITERKQAEEQTEILSKFPSENPFPVLRINHDGILLYANEASDPLLKDWGIAINDSVPAFWGETVTEVLDTRSSKKVEIRIKDEVFSIVAAPVLKAGYVNLYGRNITESKLAEAEIQRDHELLNSIFETSRDGIVLENEHGIITFINRPYKELFGYRQVDELIGKNVSIVRSPGDNERMLEYSRRRLIGEPAPSIYEYTGRCKDGNTIDVEVSVAATEIGGKKHILSVVRDIRERKKAESERQGLEDRMRQAQKMESIGTLAGGIAHDFNNILGIILGHLSIVTRPDYEEGMRTASAETIASAVHRGANLVRQILTFARKSEVELLPVNVNESAREIWKMLKETLPKSIAFVTILAKDLPFVIIDANQLHQVLLNLCVNARDAVVEGKKESDTLSKITLTT